MNPDTPISESEAEALAAELEAENLADDVEGYRIIEDDEAPEPIRRGRGRPSLTGTSEHSPQIRVRVTPEMRAALEAIAEREHRTVSDVARDALAAYVAS